MACFDHISIWYLLIDCPVALSLATEFTQHLKEEECVLQNKQQQHYSILWSETLSHMDIFQLFSFDQTSATFSHRHAIIRLNSYVACFLSLSVESRILLAQIIFLRKMDREKNFSTCQILHCQWLTFLLKEDNWLAHTEQLKTRWENYRMWMLISMRVAWKLQLGSRNLT